MIDNTQTPPLAGLSQLTATERQPRAAALDCADPAETLAVPDRAQSLRLSSFFDGTGNNQYENMPRCQHSNVATLFRSHRQAGALLLADRARAALRNAWKGPEKA
jgi:hypothetical protein